MQAHGENTLMVGRAKIRFGWDKQPLREKKPEERRPRVRQAVCLVLAWVVLADSQAATEDVPATGRRAFITVPLP